MDRWTKSRFELLTHFRKLPKPGRFRSTGYTETIYTPRQWLRIIIAFFIIYICTEWHEIKLNQASAYFYAINSVNMRRLTEIKHLNIVFPATKNTGAKSYQQNSTKPKNVCPSTFFFWIHDKKLELNNKNILDSIVIRSSINSRMLSNVRFTIKVEFWHKNGIHI